MGLQRVGHDWETNNQYMKEKEEKKKNMLIETVADVDGSDTQ